MWQLDRAGQQAERVGMEAEDAQCRLLYSKERVTAAREGGLMLTEERDVRQRGRGTCNIVIAVHPLFFYSFYAG